MNLIQLLEAPSQEFALEPWRIRLNYNYLVNMWSFSVFDEEGEDTKVYLAGGFLQPGTNLLKVVGGSLIVVDSVSCPQSNWYNRLVTPFADGIPQTVLVYDV